ncbi:hypothetical protein CSQ88_18230 [Iodobacter sp. BJB302]|nr:hypothetical protein CSQ88_18230 [Iodobacter sp. BJB302]
MQSTFIQYLSMKARLIQKSHACLVNKHKNQPILTELSPALLCILVNDQLNKRIVQLHKVR